MTRILTAEERGWSLHDYQVVASEYLRGRGRAALLLDMGLGKTAASLTAIEPRHLPVLVVAPKRVAEEVWDVETAIWRPDLTCRVAVGGPAERARQIGAEDADIVVISRDNFADIAKVKRKRDFKTLIIDELSGYKNGGQRGSKRWKDARRISKDWPYVWGLTGTPSPNGLLDLWGQIALLDGGERLGKTLTAYRNRYFLPGRQLPNGTVIEWHLREGADQRIFEAIEDICLAMETDGRINLPPKTINPVKVSLPKPSQRVYRKIAADLVVDLKDLLGVDSVHTAGTAAGLTTKLSQIAAGFIFDDPILEDTGEVDEDGLPVFVRVNEGAYTPLNTAKIDALKEIVEATDSPVLVFYRYVPEQAAIMAALPQARSITERGVIKDWNAGKVPVLVAHPQSAGHGLNLQTGGHTIVWTSLTWSLEEWDQANKRLLRQGQKHPVVIHTLMIGTKSIDHLIASRLVDKAVIQDSLLAYLESPI